MIRLIKADFIPVQVNVREALARPLIERFHQFWTPYVLVLTAGGAVAEASYGYLPPAEFLPLLSLGLGKADLIDQAYERAADRFRGTVARHPQSFFAPEAQYWLGVASYRRTHRAEDLLSAWRVLRERYPESIWRVKQSFTEERRAAA